MKTIQTQLKYTCNRCKTELLVDVPPMQPVRKGDLFGDDDDTEDVFTDHCNKFGNEALAKAHWSSVHIQARSKSGFNSTYDLCTECAADTAVFLSSIEAFTNQEECRFFTDYCTDHEFTHGAEATELREGVEQLLEQFPDDPPRAFLQGLLDRVDARDSLAYAEHLEKEKSAQNSAQEKTAPEGQAETED